MHCDAREAELSGGTVFYLYFPFRGAVAETVAHRLGQLARHKDIRVYAAGPMLEYGEYFDREVQKGHFTRAGRRGEFEEVQLLRSAG